MRRIAFISTLLAAAFCVTPAQAVIMFLDLTSVTPANGGPTAGFAGSLGSVGVTGALVTTPGFTTLFETGTNYFNSTTDNTSPQYSYGTIYTPSQALTDRVGYGLFTSATGTSVLTITFTAPVTNPVFHIANLDSMVFDFSPTAGLGGLTLQSGNGGGGDGLTVGGSSIADANPVTLAGVDPATPPPTTGERSGYGSVLLSGTFSVLTLNFIRNPALPFLGGDGGTFTLSVDIPVSGPSPIDVPSSLILTLTALGGLFSFTTTGLRRRSESV